MIKFKSKKGSLFLGTFGVVTGIFVYSILSDKFRWPFSFLLFLPPCLLAWNYFSTYYLIENGKLKYRSGIIKGEIDISTIQEIYPNKSLWFGLKPALAQKGIIIKYNKFDEIYISPENNERFTEELIKINPSILVKYPDAV